MSQEPTPSIPTRTAQKNEKTVGGSESAMSGDKESLKSVIDPSQSLLSTLHELGAPSVSQLTYSLPLPSWAFRGFISEIYDTLGDLVPISQNFVYFGHIPFFSEEGTDDENAEKTEESVNYSSYFINKSEKGGFGSYVPGERRSAAGQGLGALSKATGVPAHLFSFFKESWRFALVSLVRNDLDSIDALFAAPPSPTPGKFVPGSPTAGSTGIPEFSFYGPLTVDSGETLFIPRYPFSVIGLNSENIKIWTYNWASGLTEKLFKQVQKLGDWTKHRQGLLSGILHQKMGLFYHVPAPEQPQPGSPPFVPGTSLYSLNNIDTLINNFSPSRSAPTVEKEKPERKGRERKGPIGPGFESILKYTYPLEPMGSKRAFYLHFKKKKFFGVLIFFGVFPSFLIGFYIHFKNFFAEF